MKNASSQITRPTKLLAVAAVAFWVCGLVGTIHAAEPAASAQSSPPAFDGGKSTWHDGFVRYDFTMDDETLAITPFTRPEKESFAVGSPAMRRMEASFQIGSLTGGEIALRLCHGRTTRAAWIAERLEMGTKLLTKHPRGQSK